MAVEKVAMYLFVVVLGTSPDSHLSSCVSDTAKSHKNLYCQSYYPWAACISSCEETVARLPLYCPIEVLALKSLKAVCLSPCSILSILRPSCFHCHFQRLFLCFFEDNRKCTAQPSTIYAMPVSRLAFGTSLCKHRTTIYLLNFSFSFFIEDIFSDYRLSSTTSSKIMPSFSLSLETRQTNKP